MSGKKRRPEKRRRPKPAVWLVPFEDERAFIHHGHESSDDHSLCGPELFCCENAKRVFLAKFPDASVKDADWEIVDADYLLSWTSPQVFYFFFCLPENENQIGFVGVPRKDLARVLRCPDALQEYRDLADVISLDEGSPRQVLLDAS